MEKKIVSIGLPVYNGEKYLSQTLDSLLAQSYSNFEIIVSDNCSNDMTAIIVTEYIKKDSRIKYFRQELNIGAARNWKFVLNNSDGDYFFWASCDDYYDRSFIENLIKCFDYDNVLAVFSYYDIIDYHSNEFIKTIYPSSCTAENRFNNLFISLLNEDVLKIFGIFDLKNLKLIVNRLNSDDYFEIVVLRWTVLTGNYSVVPQRLFTYRLFQNKIRKFNNFKDGYRVLPFYLDSVKVIKFGKFSFLKKFILHVYFILYTIKLLKND